MTTQLLEEQNTNNLIQFFQSLEKINSSLPDKKVSMSLKIEKYTQILQDNLDIRYIGSREDIQTWIQIVSSSFPYSYPINIETIYNISENKNIDLVLAYKEGKAVGTGLVFETNNKINIHLISVLTEYRSQGIGQRIIQEAVNFAKREKIPYVTIQVSALNSSIFKQLGFKEDNQDN